MKLHEFIYTSIFVSLKVNTRAYNDKGRKEGRNKVSERKNRNKKKVTGFIFLRIGILFHKIINRH